MKNNPGRKAKRELQFGKPSKFLLGMEIIVLRKKLLTQCRKQKQTTELKAININDIETKYTKNCLYQIRAQYKKELKG